MLTAQQDGADNLDDDVLLLRASSLGRVLVSQDTDLLRETERFLAEGVKFVCVVYAPQRIVPIGQMVEELTLLATATEPSEWSGRVEYIPL